MSAYQLGSSGSGVESIQRALRERGLYSGPVDGRFGGGTRSAVLQFQRQRGLGIDGCVGPETLRALMGDATPVDHPTAGQSLAYRCLALTGTFETGTAFPECFCNIAGDFDGQGISFGVMQWNFGQGSLQVLLREMLEQHGDVVESIFQEHYRALEAALAPVAGSSSDLMTFVRSIQHPITHQVYEPWQGYAKALGRTKEFQEIQVAHAHAAFERALAMCDRYGLWSERAAALMFDIVTQNGGIGTVVEARIEGEIGALTSCGNKDQREIDAMRIVANRRAEAASPRWVDDVRRRKLCIANGGGSVHGIDYDLEKQFGIGLVERGP